MIELDLPWPPSVNHYWRMYQNRMVISEAGRRYRSAVAEQILIQRGAKHFAGKIKVTIAAYRPDERKRDLDNLLKSTLDALAHAGVYVDDSLIVDLRVYWEKDKAGMLKVTIEELQ